MKIVPAILSMTFEDFLHRLRQAESFTDYVEIDLMDGVFVSTRSFDVEKINAVQTSLTFQLHIMAKDPLSFLKRVNHQSLKTVVFHFESDVDSDVDSKDIVRRITEKGLEAGLAVNPETHIDQFKDLAVMVPLLKFLTVDPGDYGKPFRPEVLRKIETARSLFPEKSICVDGGVSLENLKSLMEIGVDRACIGSKVFLAGNPAENYKRFLERVKELERIIAK